MAEIITRDGQPYMKRDPLVVLGLSIITFGIYWLVWYYKINDEIRRYEKDETVSPGRSLLAVTLGIFLIVPPFIAVYNTSLHIVRMEQRAGIQQELSPALNVLLFLVVAVGIGMYSQEHLNRVWGAAPESTGQSLTPAMPSPAPQPSQ
jgi:uncharacterized protein DUF4234